MSQEKLPRTYTVKQVSELFKVHESTIRLQIRQGNIRAVKVGRHYLILEDEVNRLLKGGWKRSRSWKRLQIKRPKPEG